MNEWFKNWFDSELYLSVYNHRDDADAKRICDLLIKTTKIEKGDSILDAACGAGRHANYFSSLGYNVTGFDLSKTLLKVATKDAGQKNLHINFICADIRNVYFKHQFDLVVNLFTSFGYFFTDEENFSFIKNVAEFVKLNGYYVLDYFNPEYVKRNLVEESIKEIDGISINEKRRITNNRVEKDIRIIKGKEEKIFKETVALYTKNELEKSISLFGFRLDKVFGDYYGNDFKESISPRLILLFKR